MKRYLMLLSLSVIILTGCNKKEESFLSKVVNSNKNHNSIHYKVTEQYYYSNASDTIVTPFDVWAVKDERDTLRKGYVSVNNYYRPYNMTYEQGNFYLTIPPKKTTILYKHFTEPFISSIDWIDIFLKPAMLIKLSKNPNVTLTFTDTLYKKKHHTKMVVNVTKNNKLAERSTYIIDNNTFVPVWAKLESFKKDYVYNDELDFSRYQFDKVNFDNLKKKQKILLNENPVELDGDGSETSRLEKMLHIGDKAPFFSGRYYKTGKKFALPDYTGKKVIIVDFWYTHCPPCVRAMPYLSELNKEFKDKGLIVFGLNSVDNQQHSMKNLHDFLGKRSLSYDVILTQPTVDIMYKINGYPTMYVIDKEGRIAYVETGFDKEKFEKLKQKIETMLK